MVLLLMYWSAYRFVCSAILDSMSSFNNSLKKSSTDLPAISTVHAGPCVVSCDVVVGVVVVGGCCVVDVGGCSCVVDVGGCSCVVDAGGCSCEVDAGGCSCEVDAGGCSCVVDAGGCSCEVDAGGCSCVVDAGGCSWLADVGGCSCVNSPQTKLSGKTSNSWSGISSHGTRSSQASISSHDSTHQIHRHSAPRRS